LIGWRCDEKVTLGEPEKNFIGFQDLPERLPATSLDALINCYRGSQQLLKRLPATSLEASSNFSRFFSNFSRGTQQLLQRLSATSLEAPSNFFRGSQQLL
jgi:hypothetical protein